MIDAVGTAEGIKSALDWLASGPFKERELKLVLRDKNGAEKIGTLNELRAERETAGSIFE